MVDVLKWDWEPDTLEGTYIYDQDVLDIFEGKSLILFLSIIWKEGWSQETQSRLKMISIVSN
jgi:hypothetical protein